MFWVTFHWEDSSGDSWTTCAGTCDEGTQEKTRVCMGSDGNLAPADCTDCCSLPDNGVRTTRTCALPNVCGK